VHRQSDAKRSHKGASEPFDVPEMIDQSSPVLTRRGLFDDADDPFA
jgi:hypothetical protein